MRVAAYIALFSNAFAGQSASAQIGAVFASVAGEKSPGLAVLVQRNGEIVFEQSYGLRELRTPDARITVGTNFRLASFTKQFTAMATMLLVRDGKLRYDESLTDVFPDFPAYGRRITIRNLLTHTSGLPDYEELMDRVEKTQGPTWSATHQISDQEVLGLLKRETHGKFEPGTSWAYSNSGYVVLGLIDAKAAGEPFPRLLHDRIFHPLRMTRSIAYVNGVNKVPERAYGYSKQGEAFVETDQSSTSATLGDGGVYSNLTDLATWDKALASHTLLTAQEMSAALEPVKLSGGVEPRWPTAPGDDNLNPGQPVSYGFGWFLDSYRGRPRMWHSGTTMGFRTVIERFTGDKLTVIVLCNRSDLNATELALRAADAALGAP
ncbi:MAG: beta-lactamase family protein [Acidobacteriaceae bacterium]|nr:beta-lactamase family protein [Acidobacteriaceae bacterium]